MILTLMCFSRKSFNFVMSSTILGETVTGERLTTIILDALPEERNGTHADDQCYHQRNGSRNSSADSKSTEDETFVEDSNVTDCDVISVAVTEKSNVNPRKMTNRTIRRLALSSVLRCVIPPYVKKLAAFNSW